MMRILRSIIYTPPVNRVIRGLTRVFGAGVPDRLRINPSGVVRIRVARNMSLDLKTNQTSHVTRRLYWDDPLDFEYTAIFIRLIREMKTFWDIGSNIGYYAILGCKVNEALRVEAFEPSGGPATYLADNLAINGVSDRVTAHTVALSGQTGQIDFYEIVNPKFPAILNLSGEHNTGRKKNLNSRKVTVPSERLDAVRRRTAPVDFMKIDVEGAELQVLEGGLETLRTDRPIVVCEILKGSTDAPVIENLLRNLDYVFYAHRGGELVRIDALAGTGDLGATDFFFIPREKESLLERIR